MSVIGVLAHHESIHCSLNSYNSNTITIFILKKKKNEHLKRTKMQFSLPACSFTTSIYFANRIPFYFSILYYIIFFLKFMLLGYVNMNFYVGSLFFFLLQSNLLLFVLLLVEIYLCWS